MTEPRAPLRLFVEYDLVDGHAVPASAGQHRYLRSVMRRRDGDPVALFNGRDGEWLARLSFETRARTLMIVERELRPQRAPLDLWLAFAPVKAAAMNNVARMATELGVGRFCPVLTDHTRVDRVNSARLRANAVEAAEQSARLNVPVVDEPVQLAELMSRWDPARRIVFCADTGEPAEAAFSRLGAGGPWTVLTGPEGGFSRPELDALVKLPFVAPVRLGPCVLRADTAALAALVCWQIHLGDWIE